MNPPTIYLDNAGTSWPKPACVIEAMTRFQAQDAGNPGRALHRMAVATDRMLADVRAQLTRLVGGDTPERMILCLNGSDALNIAIKGVLEEGDHVVTSAVEHNSVSRPLQAMAHRGWISLTRVQASPSGVVDPDDVRAAMTPKTRLVTCLHASNVTGAIQPIEDIGLIARKHDALFLVDAAQSAGVLPISVGDMHIDLLAFPGHKSLLGPAGTGALYVGPRANLKPFREGGTGVDSETPLQPTDFPFLLEAGTPNTIGFAGLLAALEVLAPETAIHHERRLLRRLVAGVDSDRVRFIGDPDVTRRVGVVSFLVDGIAPMEMAAALDRDHAIAVRPGLHCAPYVHKALGTYPDGTVRVSVGPFTTNDEIDTLAAALCESSKCATA
jgi:cysteine desulfurase / selenocysteine lyase